MSLSKTNSESELDPEPKSNPVKNVVSKETNVNASVSSTGDLLISPDQSKTYHGGYHAENIIIQYINHEDKEDIPGKKPKSHTRFEDSKTNEGHYSNDDFSKVAQMLRDIGLSQLEHIFAEEEIEVADMGELTETDLEDMGVKKKGHRLKLLRAIKSFPVNEELILALNPERKSKMIKLSQDNLQAQCRDNPFTAGYLNVDGISVPVVQAINDIQYSKQTKHYYFEMKVLSGGSNDETMIGLAPGNCSLSR